MRLERRVGEGKGPLVVVVIAPEQSAFVGLDAGPFVHDVIGEIEVFRNIYAEVFRKVLVGVEIDARTECIEQVVRHGYRPYSAMMVTKRACVSPPHRWP